MPTIINNYSSFQADSPLPIEEQINITKQKISSLRNRDFRLRAFRGSLVIDDQFKKNQIAIQKEQAHLEELQEMLREERKPLNRITRLFMGKGA